MDSGASFSCLSFQYFQKLKEQGVPVNLVPTRYGDPVAADGSSMPIMGDVLLDVKFHGKLDGENELVHIQNCRFAIFKALSSHVILGIDNLALLQFEISPTSGIKIGAARMSILSLKPEFAGRSKFNFVSSMVCNQVRWCLYRPDQELDFATDAESSRCATKEVEMKDYLLLPLSMDATVSDTILASNEPVASTDNLNPTCDSVRISSTSNTGTESRVENSLNKEDDPSPILKDFIAQLTNLSQFSKKGKNRLWAILTQNMTVFSTEDTDVGEYKLERVKLELKPGQTEAAYVPSRRIPFALREWLEEHLMKSLRAGIIEKCKGSSYNSPLFLVKKSNGSWRPVSDFRLLNNQLVDNHWPLPYIRDLLDRLHGKQLFSAWDLRSGFYNLVLEPSSRHLTAFNVLGSTYQFVRLPQGIKISPAIFQRVIEEIAGELVPKEVSVYLDDLICYSENEEDALKVIESILQKFRKAGLKFNPKKCKLGQRQIEYLGYQISSSGWKPTTDKIRAICEVGKPETVTELRQFLGMANFHIPAVADLQIIMGPMHRLTGTKKKTDLVEWTSEAEEAFVKVKKAVQQSAELAFFSEKSEDYLILTTDASLKGHSSVLSQYQTSKGREQLLGCNSGSFVGAKTRWPIFEMEMFAFVEGLRCFDTYLFGRSFTWRTDNKALSYFRSEGTVRRDSQRLSPKVARWLTFIESFDFSVEHFGGETNEMALADILSRNHKPSTDKASTISSIMKKLETIAPVDDVWLKSEFGQLPNQAIMALGDDKNVLRKFNLRRDLWFEIWSLVGMRIADIMDAQDADANLKALTGVYSDFQKPGYTIAIKVGLKMVQRRKQWLVIVPENLVSEVLGNSHGPNHNGAERINGALKDNFWIYNRMQRIKEFVRTCPRCLAVKPKVTPLPEPILQTTSEGPWISVHVDLAGPMTPSYDNNRYILVIIDSLTRFMEASAIPDKSADSVVKGILEIFTRRGMPASVLADNGAEFRNKILYDTLKRGGCYLQHTTPYSPQSNGLVERANQKIKRLFKLWECNALDWEDHLSAAVYLINNTWNKNIKSTPWLCFHGWQNCDTFDRRALVKEEYTPPQSSQWAQTFVEKRNRELCKLYRLDLNTKIEGFNKLRSDYLQKARKSPLQEGDLCLVYQFQPRGSCGKIFNNWKGIYVIEKQLDKNVFLISLIGHRRRKFMIHRNRLRKIEDVKKFNDQLAAKEVDLGVRPTEDNDIGPSVSLKEEKPVKILEEDKTNEHQREKEESPGDSHGAFEQAKESGYGSGRLRSGRLFTAYD